MLEHRPFVFVKADAPAGHSGLYSTIGRRHDTTVTWSRRIFGHYYQFTMFNDEHRVEISKYMQMGNRHYAWVVVHYINFDYPEEEE